MNLFRVFEELDEVYTDEADEVLVSKAPKHELDLSFDDIEEPKKTRWADQALAELGRKPKSEWTEPDWDTYHYCMNANAERDYYDSLDEGIFDIEPSGLSSWKAVSTAKPVNNAPGSTVVPTPPVQPTPPQATQTPATTKYIVRIVSHGGRLRALATDGVHPAAFVAFPNNLRQFEGQKYEVDQLIWNGKNYRVAGNIVEI
jgi:hypothetical protein